MQIQLLGSLPDHPRIILSGNQGVIHMRYPRRRRQNLSRITRQSVSGSYRLSSSTYGGLGGGVQDRLVVTECARDQQQTFVMKHRPAAYTRDDMTFGFFIPVFALGI